VTRFVSEALSRHDRSGFTSGHERVDRYFRSGISQDVKRNYAKAYVLIERDSGRPAGFYTLSASNIPLGEVGPELARKLPRYPTIPAPLIGWLGRDSAFRGQDIGALLLYDAIHRVRNTSIGAYTLLADAIDERAVAFYRKHQFISFTSRPQTLFLPLGSPAPSANVPG
jgi:GNAT superfamily N-acetyltransferase